jgi:hypothetical protein
LSAYVLGEFKRGFLHGEHTVEAYNVGMGVDSASDCLLLLQKRAINQLNFDSLPFKNSG